MAAAAALGCALAVAGCSSSGGAPPSSPPVGTPAASVSGAPSTGASASPTTSALTTPGAPTTTTATGTSPLCPESDDVQAVVDCLEADIGTFWSRQLKATIREPVVLNPTESAVPKKCRPGLTAAPAFTCPGDGRLYLSEAFASSLQKDYPGPLESYAFAVVLAHEIGHVVQLHVKQPQIEQANPDPDTIRFVEQQADCLSGVWAHDAATTLKLDPARYRTVALQVLTGISTTREVASHGTPEQRVAAIDRGLQGGTPAACQLKGS